MDSWMHLVESNGDTTDLEADFNLRSVPEEDAVVEVSPPAKENNKKRSKNFTDKEDILLASAWLEVSTDAVQSIDQTRGTYWQRIVEYYHKHKTFQSERNLNSLSHRWGIISSSVSKFCGWYCQIIHRNQSGVTEQDKIQQACTMYKENDQDNKSFVLMHCWNVLRHAQKWQDFLSKDDGNNNNKKKHKTSSDASPGSSTPGTKESCHVDEEDGSSHTSPRKGSKGRPAGQKKEKERRGTNSTEPIYMQAMENLWSKREKADELKEIMKKERNDGRLALEARKIEIMQQAETRRIQLMQQAEDRNTRELDLKQRMDDEKIMNMDLSGMSELRLKFYMTCQEEIIARRLNKGGS